jgi:hypothetical protein
MKQTVPVTTDEALDDIERELMDPEAWDLESTTEGRTVGRPGAVLCLRFSREEILAMERLARKAGIGPEELLRQTMLKRISADSGS